MSPGSIWEPPRSSPLGLDPEPTSWRGRVVFSGGGMADDLHLMELSAEVVLLVTFFSISRAFVTVPFVVKMSDCSARRSSKMPHPNDLHRSTQSASAPPGDAAQLPQGQCRYILTIPELKGHRCGCMGFHHNTSLPGATCYCGHFSCFHSSTSLKTSEDITALKKRVRELEAQLQQKGSYQLENLVGRISDLEETVEGNQEEAANQLKASYQNSSAAWQVIEALQERIKSLENYCQLYCEQMIATRKEVKELYNRQLEMMDGEEGLEERIKTLEDPGNLLPLFQTGQIGSVTMDTR